MRRLHFFLAWSECRAACWYLAVGAGGPGEAALSRAFRLLEQSARSRDGSFGWRPIVAPRHGLTVVESRRG